MKIREGFVSNSSSSSFIVALPADKSPIISIKVDISKFASNKISTIAELNRYWKRDRDELDEDYENCRKAIEAGKVVYLGWFSDEDYDNGMAVGLCHRGLKAEDMPDGSVIIHSEEGY